MIELLDRFCLLKLVAEACPAPVCAEVGVYRGDYALQICRVLAPSKLVLIDPWRKFGADEYDDYPKAEWDHVYEYVLRRFGGVRCVTILRAMSEDAATQFPDQHFDFVYIDANHAYKHIKADLLAWWPKVKHGGFIAGHDYDQRQIARAVVEVLGAGIQVTSKPGLKSFLMRRSS